MCCASVVPVRPSRMSVFSSRMSIRSSRMSVRPSGMPVHLSSLAVLLAIICVAALTPHDEIFRYQLLITRRSEACTMCFGDECWPLQEDRCRYYAEASEVLPEGEAGATSGGEVDDLVHDMVAQAAASWMSQDCIPLVSQHTDCNKENICVGCRSCSCDVLGKWNCKAVQRCRAEPDLDVDHRILVSVTETLKDGKTTRMKRSIENKTEASEAARKLNYADIAEWMYGVKPGVDSTTNSITELTPEKNHNTDSESDLIEFDEVLKNIATDNNKYKRRKPQLNETNYEFNDYMDFDETIAVKNNDTDQFVNILNAIVEGNEPITVEPIIEESTKVVIDLLVPSKRDENVSNYINLNSNIIKEENYPDDGNDTVIFDAINIMKRDVSAVLKLKSTTETTTDKITNTSKSIYELKNNVLIPLTKIIDDKQQELKDLIKIKDNLIQFIKDYNKTNLDLAMKSQQIINSTNTVLSIYNLDIYPEIQSNLRKISPNSLDKLLYKLKRDIYEVIRDVVGIKKVSNTNNLPDDLGNLIRAMSIYVRKQGNATNIVQKKDDKYLRRQLYNGDGINFNSTKDYLIKILEVLDKDMPQTEALSSLAPGTRKIVKRVIKNHYADDFSVIGLRVYEPEYNLTNDLRNVGNKWQRMTANVAASAPADKIYAMKLLHFTLSVDINKLNDALALIDFAHSRRMIPIEGSLGEELLDKINSGLRTIDEKIQLIMKYRDSPMRPTINPTESQSKRKSFLNKIRNLLKGSKKDIVELANKNVPRSEIVRTVAKKRLDELARKRILEYEETMRKWQTALSIIPRYRRSLDLGRSKNRLKNIIPKYLRATFNPAMLGNKIKKTRTQNDGTLKKQTKKQIKIVTTTVKTETKAPKRINARNRKSTIKTIKIKPIGSKTKTIKNSRVPKAKSLKTWRQ